jgi:hypothetical protein
MAENKFNIGEVETAFVLFNAGDRERATATFEHEPDAPIDRKYPFFQKGTHSPLMFVAAHRRFLAGIES